MPYAASKMRSTSTLARRTVTPPVARSTLGSAGPVPMLRSPREARTTLRDTPVPTLSRPCHILMPPGADPARTFANSLP